MRTSQFPEQAARTHAAGLTVEQARSDAAGDPRAFEFGKVQTLTAEHFTARVWRQERFTATVTSLDTNEVQELEASSRTDLDQLLINIQHNLLAAHQQARVEARPSRTVWVAQLDFLDGTIERAEAADYDALLATLLSWVGRTTAAAQPAKPAPPQLQTVAEADAAIAAQQFLDLVGDAFNPTSSNWEKLFERARTYGREITLETLTQSFHYLNDRLQFEEGEGETI